MSGFATLDSIKKKNKKGEDGDEEQFYAGGANSQTGGGSGLSILGPRGGDNADEEDSVKRIFNRARAEQREDGGSNEGEFVAVTFYRNGFTVDGGPLRERGVRENDDFIDSVSRGVCPPELVKNGKPQNVKLEDKTEEDYVPPAYVAFGGAGTSIGGAGNTVQDEASIITPLSAADMPEVDEKEPTIRVQIKYPDNTRQVVKFNKHHTVHDLISVVHCSGKVNDRFILIAPRPPKPIEAENFTKTITEAGLANASVTVSTKI
mmetsp:Transcript_30819/g.38042  ORF Transcript_30819/g.38042 Transcript_30819/m.38042 type:complete len:262 (-) Transcript_30819:745-1530(-)|eukprot:CAMPEP_0204826344 /NCGR_PEP_ID=MMETSP1346-20131115/4053_1 /ASSEMBLY_ACC=CAM_ASM_000771 /TAXON_ID=215587 /ORGANISM="Aplanochytrium stocchinoi, Strain GSBS06" /LENGTH=261 /DNA_ID=CAMNT_0051954323 /DNA_START=87 /DNA_END=872 /DNA_ORIENTATION=+